MIKRREFKRREFVTGALIGGLAVESVAAQGHKHEEGIDGPLANAIVSFGAWPSEPPLDRPNLPAGAPPPNIHQLIPHTVRIKAGGTVNFVVAGFHNIVVYGPGTTLQSIDSGKLSAVPGVPMGVPFPPVVDDPFNRVFRGVVAFGMPLDRVEVVHFPNRGRYLVVCAFLPHFLEGMSGWVDVLP